MQIPTRKNSKLLSNSVREDVLLDTITITYRGSPLPDSKSLGSDIYTTDYHVPDRCDVTDFINPVTGCIQISIEWLTDNVKGFKDYVEVNYQERSVINLAVGLRSDKYKVEWRKSKSKSKSEGFSRSVLSKIINPKDV